MAKTSVSVQHEPIALSVDACTRVSGIGRTRLYEAISNGELSSVKVGRRRLIRVAALEAWLADLERRVG